MPRHSQQPVIEGTGKRQAREASSQNLSMPYSQLRLSTIDEVKQTRQLCQHTGVKHASYIPTVDISTHLFCTGSSPAAEKVLSILSMLR